MGVVLTAESRNAGKKQYVLDHIASVGRVGGNDFVLDDGNVSKNHARFLYQDGRVVVTDLKSTNGTYINGRRITQATILREGDVVYIGNWTIKFEHQHIAFAPRDPREKSLLDAIARSPHDDALRQVYGDWLEEHGYAVEAELISLEREIRLGGTTINDQELGRLGYRLRTVAATLPEEWRVLVARPPIERCADLRFELTCPKAWDHLVPTNDPLIRSCNACKKSVYFASTIDLARKHVEKGRCVAVDISIEREPRDLDVPVADRVLMMGKVGTPRPPTAPITEQPPPIPPPPPPTSAVTELPFFMKEVHTVGELFASLRLASLITGALDEYSGMGSLWLPDLTAIQAQPLSEFVGRVYLNYSWDMYHSRPYTRFDEVTSASLVSFTISFRRDAGAIEQWLRARYGAPREAAYEGDLARMHHVYGKWLFYTTGRPGTAADINDDNNTCTLEWCETLPEWALPQTNASAALSFLSELAQVMRNGASHEEIKTFASRPPAQSGIVVKGPMYGENFWLEFEPKLSAFDIARAFAIDSPVGTSGDVHMSSWSVVSLQGKELVEEPAFGPWTIEVALDGWPGGASLEGFYACKQLLEKDRVRTLAIKRPRN